jgi:hypothetical protein
MREFIRHPSSIPLIIKQTHDKENGSQTLNNVSLGGIACNSTGSLEKGEPVSVSIDYVEPSFNFSGIVKWCHPEQEHFNIGIQFLVTEEDEHRLRMIEQICHIEHYRNEMQKQENRVLSSEEAAQEWISKFASSFPR